MLKVSLLERSSADLFEQELNLWLDMHRDDDIISIGYSTFINKNSTQNITDHYYSALITYKEKKQDQVLRKSFLTDEGPQLAPINR